MNVQNLIILSSGKLSCPVVVGSEPVLYNVVVAFLPLWSYHYANYTAGSLEPLIEWLLVRYNMKKENKKTCA